MHPIWQYLKSPPSEGTAPLAWHPDQLEACLAARAEHIPSPLGTEELDQLRAAHHTWQADAASLENIEKLGRPTTRVVVTGQQPGLMAGPLLVIYKTLGAIKLARELQTRHPELQFVPIFWLASEDHDFAEIRRLVWPGFGGTLETALLSAESHTPGQMVGLIRTAPFWVAIKEQITQSLPRTSFSDQILIELEAVLGSDEATVESGFARLLLRLTRGLGLVIVTPTMTWLRCRAIPILKQDFEAAGAISARVNERGAELTNIYGIEPPLTRAAGALNAFWLDDAGRRHTLRVNTQGGVERALAGSQTDATSQKFERWPLTRVVEELERNPLRFSTNVVTRPMLQDSALPVVAQVVGPGEAAYLAQVEAVYPEFKVFAPVRYPRPEALLVEPRVSRQMEKHSISMEEALTHDPAALTDLTLQRSMASTDELHALDALESRQRAELAELRTRLADGDLKFEQKPDPAIVGAFAKLDGMLEKGYATIRERVLYKRRQSEGQLQRSVATVSHALNPGDQPQERVLNPFLPFAWNFGLDWVLALEPNLHIAPQSPVQQLQLQHSFEVNHQT